MRYGYVCTSHKNAALTVLAVESLQQGLLPPQRIVVVDNASGDADMSVLEALSARFSAVEIVANHNNVGYFAGLNDGIRRIRALEPNLDCLVIGNNDLEFPPEFGATLQACLPDWNDLTVVSPNIRTLDGLPQNPHVINGISRIREMIYDLYYMNYELARLIVGIARMTQRFTDRADEKSHDVAQFVQQGHGSVYLLMPKFFNLVKELHAPTFLFGEEYFLSHQLSAVGQKVYYDPRVTVRHRCHGAIGNVPRRQLWELARVSHKIRRMHAISLGGGTQRGHPPVEGERRVCANCVMDTTDPQITFDEGGVCDHCRGFKEHVEPHWHPNEEGRRKFERTIAKIRETGRGKNFDCILGMSGGLDSSFLLHMAVTEFKLRPLVFHVDGGWNTDIAVSNIQSLVEKLNLDLYTEVINWNEMRDFQLAFFKAGVPHLDVPQDHAFVATLYKFAEKQGIKYILNGGNISTECVRNPLEWVYYGTDMRHLNDIIRRFGTVPMKTYPFSSIYRHKLYLRYFRGVKVVKPLDWMPYTKAQAKKILVDTYGWKPYPQKHFESRFTRFFESYWLPERFGYDTRKVQFSSLILTGQMTRADALAELEHPAYDPATIDNEFSYIARKLGITSEELRSYFTMPLRSFRHYRNQERVFELGARLLQAIGIEKAIKR